MDKNELFASLEAQYRLPSNLLPATMHVESRGNINAVSPKGAKGPFQFMDATAKQYNVNPFDLTSSATGAARMFSDLLKTHNGDLDKALASYNWGQGNVARKGLDKAPKETRDYIAKVKQGMGGSGSMGGGGAMEEEQWVESDIPAKISKPTTSNENWVESDIPAKIGKSTTSNEPKNNSLLRQLGLTTRYITEGLADTAGIFSDPIAATSNMAFGTELKPLRTATTNLLNNIGLPQPEGARERTVADASRLLSGTGGFISGANLAAKGLPATGKAVAELVASRPGLQASSAIGAGYLGGQAREMGAGAGGQFGAALAGGILAPLGVAGLSSLANSAGTSIKNTFAPQTIDLQVENVLKQSGIDLSGVHRSIQESLRNDVRQALSTGKQVSPDVVRRLADYKGVGAIPMRSNLTLNPVDITRDKNLAKLAANSTDPVAQKLPMIQNENNVSLIRSLNELGANTSDDAFAAGGKIISALEKRDNAAKSLIGAFYDKARATNGRSANLDPYAFTQKANNLLDDALLGGKLPSDVRNLLNKSATGQMPLTVDVAEQFKTRIGDLQRATTDMAERKALGLVRSALDDTPLIDDIGGDAIKAFNQARRINRAYMGVVEKTPALQAVRDGIEPDKFVQKFIIGQSEKSNLMDVSMLKKNIKGNKAATDAVKGQILQHLKNKALNNASDEIGNFSQSAYNNALKSIGERKLNLFFDKSEIEQLNRIGRVASYESVQPKGSAVNNSNTASAALNGLIELVGKLPFGKSAVTQPAQNIKLSIGARNSLNNPKSLTIPNQSQPLPMPIWPLLGTSGLMTSE